MNTFTVFFPIGSFDICIIFLTIYVILVELSSILVTKLYDTSLKTFWKQVKTELTNRELALHQVGEPISLRIMLLYVTPSLLNAYFFYRDLNNEQYFLKAVCSEY